MKDVDGVFDYRVDAWSGRESTCRIRVYQIKDGHAVVIATELEENKGPSVTNSAEAWAREACTEYSLDPFKTYFFEHYDGGSYRGLSYDEEERYAAVSFEWFAGIAEKPKWTHATRADIEKLIGEKFD
jgi:hypothetical protein